MSILESVGALALAGPPAAYLIKTWVESRLATQQARLEGEIRRDVDTALAERSARRTYEWEARKRLYEEIGPARFQLLLACRDVKKRVRNHGMRQAYATDLGGYYGQSTLYRILRPLALGELIERRVARADFSVDSDALGPLKLKQAATRALTGTRTVRDHPGVDWSRQTEHVMRDALSRVVATLLVSEGQGERVLRVDEFVDQLGREIPLKKLHPFDELLVDFSIESKPILWMRLVAFGHICDRYLTKHGAALGFEIDAYPLEDLFDLADDPHFQERRSDYLDEIRELPVRGL